MKIGSSITYKNVLNQDKSKIFVFNLLKVCNQIKIFHLNKSTKNTINFQTYNFGENTNNFVKLMIPYSLTAHDLDYFLQILNQFNLLFTDNLDCQIDGNDLITLDLNISLILSNLNMQDSGKFRINLLNFLEKISHITITYEKKITENNLILKGSGSLMNYKVLLKKSPNINSCKKIKVSLNKFFYLILKKSNYNYKLINMSHIKFFPSSQLRLIYYYICLKTTPGMKYFKEISLENFLDDLWINTSNDSTKRTRKQRLITLLKKFSNYLNEDLDLIFFKQKNSILLFDNNYIYIKVKREKRLISRNII